MSGNIKPLQTEPVPELLTDHDIYLFKQGTHFRLYDRLGSHPVVQDGVAGTRFGVWAPQDLQYSNTLSTALPWIYPLTIGIYAATSEEFLFRLFAIPWLLRVTRSKLLAIVLPALAWGFLHANYPQEPAYIRGIEVGAIGIVAGLVMLRWGILATLVWHYTVDAFLIGLSLMRSADLYSRVSGTLVGLGAFIPVAIAGVLYLRRGGFAGSYSGR